MHVQGYFSYDSKKSGGITVSHLRFGKSPIHSTYLVNKADFIACHNSSYIDKYDMVSDLKNGGTFLLNCPWAGGELDNRLPSEMKKYIANHNIKFYTIDAIKIAKELGLGNRINTVMQAGFFKLANIIPVDEAVKYMKEAIFVTYGKKGEAVVNMNYQAVDSGIEGLRKVEVPVHWADLNNEEKPEENVPEYIKNILEPVNRQQGDKLPVSAFIGREDGTYPQGTSKYEKRGIAIEVPVWDVDKCIQCNQCSYVCPHAAIRPFLLNREEVSNAPEEFASKKAIGNGLDDMNFRMQVSVLDCTGCGNCAKVCPAKEPALKMMPLDTQTHEIANWEYADGILKKLTR
jgi:pyruvate-ferredoxin/flavodoxin oxidoreductase